MGKKKGGRKPDPKGGVVATQSISEAERILAQWTERELTMLLQCTPDEARQATGAVLSMTPQQLRQWWQDLLSEIPREKRADESQRFYNVFLDRKEDLGLLQAPGECTKTGTSGVFDTMSEAGSESSAATAASTTSKASSKRKYNKKLDLSKTDGHETVLPFSQYCGCEATKHKLVGNCRLCGKIACEQEGPGRCYFCGSELMRDPFASKKRDEQDEDEAANLERQKEYLKAVAMRDKLLKYQDERTKRTTIFDDQEDYYESTTNPWLDAKERAELAEKEAVMQAKREARLRKGGSYTVQLDLVNKNLSMGMSYSESLNKKDMVAPVERRKQRKEEDKDKDKEKESEGSSAPEEDEENAANICVADNFYAPKAVSVEQVLQNDEEEGEVHSYRVLRCPEAIGEIRYDSALLMESWIASELETNYDFDEKEAREAAKELGKMTKLTAIRSWVARNLLPTFPDTTFFEDMQAQSEKLEMKKLRPAPISITSAPTKEARQTRQVDEKPTVAVPIAASGKLQTDWEEDLIDDDDKSMVKKKPSVPRKPWVYINTPEAARLDQLSGVRPSMACLSMHQPWASLLVCGIKKHEGRSWETNFRGRLWIHAAAHKPSQDDIEDMEAFYQDRGATTFPTHYPTSVLLGCVTVTDCMHIDTYRDTLPVEDQESSSQYVFICSNPQQLVLPLPMDGKHKIFQLDKAVYEAVKRQARRDV